MLWTIEYSDWCLSGTAQQLWADGHGDTQSRAWLALVESLEVWLDALDHKLKTYPEFYTGVSR